MKNPFNSKFRAKRILLRFIKNFLHLHKSKLQLITLCTCFYLFALILLPALISGLFSNNDNENKPFSFPFSFHPNKLEVPSSIVIYRTAKATTEELPFEDYIKGVVASEMPSSFEDAALKAQAIAARTYSLSKVLRSGHNGFPPSHPEAALCDTVHCQVYRSPEELAEIKGQEWIKSGWNKISTAVESTAGQLMYYDGSLVEQALFHSSSGGKTENSEDVFASAVPYLKSVDSPYEEEATHRNETYTFTYTELTEKLNKDYPQKHTTNVNPSSVFIISSLFTIIC